MQLSVGLSHSVDGGGSAAGGDGDNKAGGLRTLGVVLDMGGVYGALLQAVCVMIVVGGLQASKYTVNTFCVAKVRAIVVAVCRCCRSHPPLLHTFVFWRHDGTSSWPRINKFGFVFVVSVCSLPFSALLPL